MVYRINRVSQVGLNEGLKGELYGEKDYQNDDINIDSVDDIMDVKRFVKQFYLNWSRDFNKNSGFIQINNPKILVQRLKKKICNFANMTLFTNNILNNNI